MGKTELRGDKTQDGSQPQFCPGSFRPGNGDREPRLHPGGLLQDRRERAGTRETLLPFPQSMAHVSCVEIHPEVWF